LEIALMNILNRQFEERFGAPVRSVVPLQGQLGGSGRQIIRLSNDSNAAIGIIYGVREENFAFLEFSKHFRKHGLPVPEIYGEDLDHGVTWKKIWATPRCLSSCRAIAMAKHRARSRRGLSKSCGGTPALSGASRTRSQLRSVLSHRQF